MTRPPYQQRVIDEKAELDERLGKLQQFLTTPVAHDLPFDERCLLVQQSTVMTQYSRILGERIKLFV